MHVYYKLNLQIFISNIIQYSMINFYEKFMVAEHSNNWQRCVSIAVFSSSSCSMLTVEEKPTINVYDKCI